ncbi:D-alanine--D-alanine ligase family protein [Actinoplanes sp. L3-i22]|uniref:D-alanine--D-alanine ligase family protein n=1 Tax=Actinoplanes sp. L3-i22 TaxID=2836373 RepID=UPI001C75E56C|nr:D-alanine--D-alanine ligase family protein [Actinoplanes sp. L3-i22]BCY09320.1 D-alanine--D-alanine ligase [Actinoplanes sp. L3-i22]
MSEPVRVAVIGGGRSGEHDVSLGSAASAVHALRGERRWAVVALTIGRDGCWSDEHGQRLTPAEAVTVLRGCHVALPLLHGPHGEDGTIAGFLEVAGVRYAGSGVGAGAIGMDKWVTKLVAAAIGLATAPGTLVTARTAGEYRWSGPVVVKPVGAGSSLGVSLVESADGIGPALTRALRHDDRVLVEQVIRGREIDVAVLGRADGSRVVAPPLEVVAAGIFDHAAKYDGTAEFRIPAALDEVHRKALEAAAVEVYDVLGCRGVARVDFFVTAAGLVLNEVNTVPGFTARSQAPRMFAAGGIDYPELLAMLIDDALGGRPAAVPA